MVGSACAAKYNISILCLDRKTENLSSSGFSPPSPWTSSGPVDSCDVDRRTACAAGDRLSSKTGRGGVRHLQKNTDT
ncbi:unnamed protein product [Macrosiphum euphorbiae]|uniref:Uncharacterized protein n=1 Tax=Macrosiphum euphorbiae TaxID=13131 RepID=A0AAV0X6A2_9HEMI|nr:unnamed protein product [Macrosiphum euphorbiae]